MAQINTSDPKVLAAAVITVAGALAGGSAMGFTFEPKELTELRTEVALQRQYIGMLEEDVQECATKVPTMSFHTTPGAMPTHLTTTPHE